MEPLDKSYTIGSQFNEKSKAEREKTERTKAELKKQLEMFVIDNMFAVIDSVEESRLTISDAMVVLDEIRRENRELRAKLEMAMAAIEIAHRYDSDMATDDYVKFRKLYSDIGTYKEP